MGSSAPRNFKKMVEKRSNPYYSGGWLSTRIMQAYRAGNFSRLAAKSKRR